MDKRTCIKCEIEYPLTDKYFSLAHGSTTRRLTICKECRKEYNKQYRLANKQEKLSYGEDVYTIKEEPLQSKIFRLQKAFNQIHIRAFGEQMTENIYWCKEDDCIQITDSKCDKCNKTMENIGFIDYNEGDK